MRLDPKAQIRFFNKLLVGDDCWEWQAGRNNRGYGVFKLAGRPVGAHRASYEHFVGPIPTGLELDHLCKNPSCVRPDHLEPVTHRENLLRGDGFAANHAAKTHCLRGHEFTPENTLNNKKGRGCRTCHQEQDRSWRIRKRLRALEGATF